jgi:hypothetical protein
MLFFIGCTPRTQYIGIHQSVLPDIPRVKNLKSERRGHVLIKRLRNQVLFYKTQALKTNKFLKDKNVSTVMVDAQKDTEEK